MSPAEQTVRSKLAELHARLAELEQGIKQGSIGERLSRYRRRWIAAELAELENTVAREGIE